MTRILVVDDDRSIAQVVRGVLEDEGFACADAQNGRDALAAMKTERPDLVVSDVSMPILDGRALVRAMRADADLKDVPVVLMSADAPRGDETAFLRKPFDLEQLLRVVPRLLAARRGAV